MEELFEFLVVIFIAAVAIASKSKKKKSSTPTKSAQAAEPIAEPAKPARPITDLTKDISRQNIENAIAAFAELLETNADLPNPDKPAPKIVREPTAIETELTKPAASKAKPAGKKPVKSGESPVDAHGCIGGSMPDHTAEGESIAEHAGHEQNRQQKLAEEAALNAASLRKPRAADLRRAVIMSEILDKPVSLRGRRI